MTDCSPPTDRASLRGRILDFEEAIAFAVRQRERGLQGENLRRVERNIETMRRRANELRAQLRALEEQERSTMLRADEHGVIITRKALNALMAFAATEDASERLDVVSLRVVGSEVTARASDGSSAVTLTGPALAGSITGAWDIVRPFLSFCAKALGGNDEIRIEPHGATVRNATVFRQSEHGEDFVEAEQIIFTYDAARLQKGFPWDLLTKALKLPRDGASGVAFNADIMARVALVQKAAGASHVELRLGDDPLAPIVVRCGHDAVVIVMPVTRETKRGGRKGADEGARDSVEQAVLDFKDAMQKLADKDGATISVQSPGEAPVVVAKPKKPRASGAKAAKTGSRRGKAEA